MNPISQRNFSQIGNVSDKLTAYKSSSNNLNGLHKLSFEEALQKVTEDTGELKFSKHANERLNSRHIDLSKSQIERLASGANKAREKGIKESLVMVDNISFIVNVRNNTVITAVNEGEDRIFTNIDGAVIM